MEKSYIDMLAELYNTIQTDAIPDKDKKQIEDLIFRLERKLEKYSA